METKTKTSRYGQKDFLRDEKMFNAEVLPRMERLIASCADGGEVKGWDNFRKYMNEQSKLMLELTDHAYKAKSMTGRILKFPHADSYAYYMVFKVNKTTCRVKWLNHGDGWVDDRLGDMGSLPIGFVHDQICREDSLNTMFSKNKS